MATVEAVEARYCGAKTRSGGECRKPAGANTDHLGTGRCAFHGGATPNHEKHARKVMAVQAATRFGLRIESTGEQALMDELAIANGMVAFYMQQATRAQEDEDEAGVKLYMRLLADERDRRVRTADVCAKLKVADAVIQGLESIGTALGVHLAPFMQRLGVLEHPEAREAVRELLASVVRPGVIEGSVST